VTRIAYLGVGAASNENQFALLSQEGKLICPSFRLPNSAVGVEELLLKLRPLLKEHDIQKLLVGTEATSMYDWHLLEYLAQSTLTRDVTLVLYRINAREIRNFKRAFPKKGKTDRLDAVMVAERLRFGNLKEPYQAQSPYLPLQRLTRFRVHVVETLVREKSFFAANLFLKFSSFKAVKPFGNKTFSKTSLATIHEFHSPEEIAQLPLEDLTGFLIRHGKNRFRTPKKVAELLKRVARESYRLRPEIRPTVDLILAETVNNIRALEKSIQHTSEAIGHACNAFPSTLTSVPGIGPVIASGLLAEIGDIHRFNKEAQLAKFAGLVWNPFESSDFKAEERRLSKNGNRYLRYYLIEGANLVRMHAPEFRAFYELKYREATKHHHKRALVLTARKLVRLVFALLKKGKLYAPKEALTANSFDAS